MNSTSFQKNGEYTIARLQTTLNVGMISNSIVQNFFNLFKRNLHKCYLKLFEFVTTSIRFIKRKHVTYEDE